MKVDILKNTDLCFSKMKYEQDIIDLLVKVGEAGLPLMSIVKHVFNAHNSFFEPIKEQNVYQSVRSYMIKNSSSIYSLFLKGEDGKYKLNPNSSSATALMLQFLDDEEEMATEKPATEEPMLPFDF